MEWISILMNIYKPAEKFLLPDKTWLRNIFSNNDVSNEFVDKLSLSIGEISPQTKSSIHIHPFVTQVTFVLEGEVVVLSKQFNSLKKSMETLEKDECIITEPNTFYQVENKSQRLSKVLYVVTPSFLFIVNSDGTLKYNDALVLSDDWQYIDNNKDAITKELNEMLARRKHIKVMCQHFLGHTIKQLFELPRILQVINNH